MSWTSRLSSGGFHLALGHLLFFGLLVLSVKYVPERIIHVDSAFQILKWVMKEGVEVEVYRFSAIFPQLLVKAAKLFGPDLHGLLLVASIAHVLVPYLIFIVAAHVWRTTWLAVACALAAVLATRLTFYGIVLEANYLLCYPFLLVAALQGPLHRAVTPASVTGVLFALFLVLAAHPVGFLLAFYVVALCFPAMKDRRSILYIVLGIALLWAGVGRLLWPPSAYEADQYAGAVRGLVDLKAVSGWSSLDFLLGHSWSYTTLYLPLWILFAVCVTVQFRRRNFWGLTITAAGVLGYAALNILTFHVGDSAMMMEKNFVPLATLVALPLSFELESTPIRVRQWSLLPYVLLLFIQFRGISFASREASERLGLIQDLVMEQRKAGVAKAAITADQLDSLGLHVHWALGAETLLASSLHGPAGSVTAAVLPQEVDPSLVTGVWLGPDHENVGPETLDPRYFQFADVPYARFVPHGPTPGKTEQ